MSQDMAEIKQAQTSIADESREGRRYEMFVFANGWGIGAIEKLPCKAFCQPVSHNYDCLEY